VGDRALLKYLILWRVKLGSAPPGRVNGLARLGEGLQVEGVVDAEPLAEVPEHQRAILFHLLAESSIFNWLSGKIG
jgi:hypothetical protein